jgi:ABC-2 type transport system permease protein
VAGLSPDSPGTNTAPAPEVPGPRPPDVREQIAVLANLRWLIFKNSLRSLRGRLELVSTIFTGLGLTVGWLGMGVGLAIGAYFLVSRAHGQWLPALFWLVFVFWQFFPIVTTVMAASFDSANLLQFPIAFSSYFWLALAYGCADPVSIAATFWLLCIVAGCAAANLAFLWAALPVLILFAAFNLLLGRALMAWIDRWLAQRRTREIMGFLFFLLLISFQLIGPIASRWHHLSGPASDRIAALLPYERALPPGLAGDALIRAGQGDVAGAVVRCIALAVYASLFGVLFAWRLRAQFRGENLSESAAPAAIQGPRSTYVSWRLKGLSPPVAAVFEKEVHSLLRSGPMLFTLIAPLFVLFIFRARSSVIHHAPTGAFMPGSSHIMAFIFPIGAAYALLILTNLIYNCLGTEGPGIQFYFVAPIQFQSVFIGKNLAYCCILLIDIVLVWVGVRFLYQVPRADIVFTTLLALVFALQVDLAAGNILSLYFPKKYDMAVFGRKNTSQVAALIGLAVQAFVIGIAGVTLFVGYFLHRPWLSDVILLLLAALAFIGYRFTLKLCNRIASERREALAAELCRVG